MSGPGWYDDPEGSNKARFWDGAGWSGRLVSKADLGLSARLDSIDDRSSAGNVSTVAETEEAKPIELPLLGRTGANLLAAVAGVVVTVGVSLWGLNSMIYQHGHPGSNDYGDPVNPGPLGFFLVIWGVCVGVNLLLGVAVGFTCRLWIRDETLTSAVIRIASAAVAIPLFVVGFYFGPPWFTILSGLGVLLTVLGPLVWWMQMRPSRPDHLELLARCGQSLMIMMLVAIMTCVAMISAVLAAAAGYDWEFH